MCVRRLYADDHRSRHEYLVTIGALVRRLQGGESDLKHNDQPLQMSPKWQRCNEATSASKRRIIAPAMMRLLSGTCSTSCLARFRCSEALTPICVVGHDAHGVDSLLLDYNGHMNQRPADYTVNQPLVSHCEESSRQLGKTRDNSAAGDWPATLLQRMCCIFRNGHDIYPPFVEQLKASQHYQRLRRFGTAQICPQDARAGATRGPGSVTAGV